LLSQSFVESAGDELSPHTVVGIDVKDASLSLELLRRDIHRVESSTATLRGTGAT